MSFEMKYDRDGNPVKSREQLNQFDQQQQEFALQQQAIEQEQPEIEATEVEQVEEQVEPETQPNLETNNRPMQPKKEDHPNFKSLRDKLSRVEAERNEALRRAQELEQHLSSSSSSKQSPLPEDDDLRIAPDELAEGKHLSKVANKVKKLESELEQYKQKNQQITIENRIKSQFPDFDKVVTPDTINALRDSYPEIASSLNQSTDLYNTAVSAYTLIKKLDIYKDNSYDADKELVQKNAAKPRPLTSISPQQGATPLTRANAFAQGLTDELKEQLRKEMYAARKTM